MTTADAPRKLLAAPERRRSIEHAAARAFGRTGFAATSMADVAAEAGVTKVLVYRHVDSKVALYRSILERVSTTLRDEFAAALADDTADAAIVAHLTTARLDPDGYRLLFLHAEREPEFAAAVGEFVAMIVDVADMAYGQMVAPEFRAWSTELGFRWLVSAVLAWLEHGDPTHDDAFLEHTSAGLLALVEHLTIDPTGDPNP